MASIDQTWVIVDANVIVSDFTLAGAGWSRLAVLCCTGRIEIGVPEHVIDEAVGVYRRRVVEQSDGLAASQKNLDRLLIEYVPPALDAEAEATRYRAEALARLDSMSATVLPEPRITIAELVAMAIARRRPFDDNGNGFRDALTWRTALDVTSRPEVGLVHLVSQDRRAFHAPKQPGVLHDDLAAQVAEEGGCALCLATDLASLAESIEQTDRALRERIEVAMADRVEDLRTEVLQAIASGDFDDVGGRVDLDEVRNVAPLRLVAAEPATDGRSASVALATSLDLRGHIRAFWGEQKLDAHAEVTVFGEFDEETTLIRDLVAFTTIDDAGIGTPVVRSGLNLYAHDAPSDKPS